MDNSHLDKINKARLKYKPEVIKCLFIAEAPPTDRDRFFYFENVREQDSLYLELMKVLFPSNESSNESLIEFEKLFGSITKDVSSLRANKEVYLKKFQEKGFYLIDAVDYPLPYGISRTKDKINFLEKQKTAFIKKVEGFVTRKTPIVLISVPVYQAISGILLFNDYNVFNTEAIEFPGTGQQTNFKRKMNLLMPRINAL